MQHIAHRVLLIAYHFPPCIGSSGLLRTQKFARYLPQSGWEPLVLTLHPRAYESTDLRTLEALPADLKVFRAFALDTKKHLGFRNRYLEMMALPDRWVSWVLGAVPLGLYMLHKHKIDVVFSTFPISTSILIGWTLHLLTGKPWIVDLRDSMTEDTYPRDPRERRVRVWIERKAARHASRFLFTASSTREMYLKRYPFLAPQNCLLIPNGFDEDDFIGLGDLRSTAPAHQINLIHTGLLYPEERDPRHFFAALSRLKREGKISSDSLRVSFRAAGSESLFAKMVQSFEIADIVIFKPHIPYRESLHECATANGLLLFQAANCNHQIPAKAYEYLRLGRPILALTSHEGDTAALLKETGGATIADLADESEIYRCLLYYLDALRGRTHPYPDPSKVQCYSRMSQARQLAACLSEVLRESSSLAQPRATGLSEASSPK